MKSRIIIGIDTQENIRQRMLAIASGAYKPKRTEPKIWFTSMKSLSEVLSDKNRSLLKIIAELQPNSLAELALLTGRQKSNLSRTLKTLENYGLVELKKDNRHLRPIAKATSFQIMAA